MPPERSYRRPVIPLTIALMIGIALGSAAPGYGPWALALASASGLGMARCLIRHTPAAVCPLLLFMALGYFALQPWVQPRFPAHHVSRFVNSGSWRIIGIVDARPLEFETRTKFVLRVERLERTAETREATGLLRVTVTEGAAALDPGDRVAINSRIRPIRNFNNPGGFDFKRSMAYQGIWGSVFISGKELELLEPQVESGILGWIDRVRSEIARLIDQAGLGSEAAVLKALVMGDQSGIAPDIRRAFTRTGTSHILAISGLHITIVASIAFALFRWLLSWIPIVLRAAWARKGAAVLTLIPITLYALIAGFSPSTQRAFIMVAVYMLAFLAERETDLMNTLALAALSILMVQPASLFSISFQLSFAAVFSIIYGLERVKTCRSTASADVEGRSADLRRGLLLFVGVSLAATWGTLALGMYYFNTVSVIGLLANCVAIPLIGYLVVGLGLAGTLLAPLSTGAAVGCYQIGGWVLSKSIALMELMAVLPWAAIRTVSPSLVEVALFYLLSWAAFHLATGTRPAADPFSHAAATGRVSSVWRAAKALPGRLHRFGLQTIRHASPDRKTAAAVLVIALIAACVDVGYWIYQRFGRQDLRLTMLDVGQGSAVLLELPGGTTALIDGGGFADMAVFDVGANVVAPFLWRQKIATVDILVLTHPNSDHLNGLVFIADNFHIHSLWTNGESRPIPGYESLMQVARKRGIAMPRYADIPRRSTISHAQWDVLYPPWDFQDRVTADPWRRDENNNSLVSRVSLGEVSILIPGDLLRPAEKELVALSGGQLKSTVLVAPHHGSRTSSSDLLLEAVAPQAVLISCGDRPGSGIPHPQVLERYENRGVGIYRTDRDGAIRLVTDGRHIAITSWLSEK
jgi:competence protein ComEC